MNQKMIENESQKRILVHWRFAFFAGTGTASIRVKDINDMPPQFTKSEWYTEVDETEGIALPDAPILTVTVHDEDETNKFHYKVSILHVLLN